ncbi:MAG: hypothetical protein J6A07_07760 [Firmicutes bacterium]|nr:hypothetical protein [Bacillota bacterium]
MKKQVEICDSNISRAESEINARQSVLNAIRDYWRLKPISAKYKTISDSKDKELFYVENMADINRYNNVTDVLNANKLPDGTLPRAEQLKSEIAEYKQSKTLNYDNRDKAKAELRKYEILMDNIKSVVKDEPKKVAGIER